MVIGPEDGVKGAVENFVLPHYGTAYGVFFYDSAILEGDFLYGAAKIPYIGMILPYVVIGAAVLQVDGPELFSRFAVNAVEVAVGPGGSVEDPVSLKSQVCISPGEGRDRICFFPGFHIYGNELPFVLDPQGFPLVEIELAF